MNPMIERRHSKRFREESVSAKVLHIDREAQSEFLETSPCVLVNISFGGMCIRSPRRFGIGETHAFLLDLRAPFNDLVMIKATARWTEDTAEDSLAGFEFTESSKGWLGPED